MHNLYSQWNFLSIKIKQLLSVQDIAVLKQDKLPLKTVAEHINQILSEDLANFRNNFSTTMPETAYKLLKTLPVSIDVTGEPLGGPLYDQVIKTLIKVKVLEAEISYFLSDTQERIRKTVNVAFAHLQRQIMVDTSIREKWMSAFKSGEVNCEKLGAVHLLQHKIWAIKAHGERARTDLVLQEPIDKNDPLYKSADGLILTEWKKVNNQNDADEQLKEAKKQALAYKAGVLFPMELSQCSYLVMVSQKKLDLSENFVKLSNGSLNFEIINIVCNPDVPSKEK